MTKKSLYIVADVADMYSNKRISRAAAALSYYLTMTFFPMIICLYYLLGSNLGKVIEALDLASKFLTEDTARFADEFMRHVARSKSPALLAAGITVLVTSSSAAIRTLLVTIGEMQGGVRFKGLLYFAFSIAFSFLFLAAMYISILIMLSGRAVLSFLNDLLPMADISVSWIWLRYLLLAGIMFLIIWVLYHLSKRKNDKYKCYPGAILATVALVLMNYIFSKTIEYSAKYSLVYGSIASIILLMLWLYFSCQIIYIGAAFNISLRNERCAEDENMLTEGRIAVSEIHSKYYEYRAIIAKTRKKILRKKNKH